MLLGAALVPLNVLFLVAALWRWGWFTGQNSLFPNAVAVLFLLAAANEVARRRRPHLALTAGELLTVYLMVVTSTGLTCSLWHFGGALAGGISYPFWFATEENGWMTLVWPFLPEWLTVRGQAALEGYFLGGGSPYRWAVVRAWGGPALWWAAFLGVLLWVCLCLNSIVRRRWADEEKLAFPITVLPVQVADERFGLLRNRLWWSAVAFSGGLWLWNIASGLIPSLPGIPLHIDYSSYVENAHPWNSIRHKMLGWSPGSIGLCYLMPLDLAFSLLVFDLLWVAEYLLSAHLGWSVSPRAGFPYGDYQVAGGFIAIGASVLWLDRAYLLAVLRRALGLSSPLRDEGEALRYSAATLGAVVGLVWLWWFLTRGGMSAAVAVVFLGLYLLMVLVLSRLRAQLGPPSHQLYGATPDWILRTAVGGRVLGPQNLGMFALLNPFLKQQSNHPAPSQLEALKMAEGGRMERSRIGLVLVLVVPATIICYFWANLHIGFHTGLATGNTHHSNLLIPRWSTDALAAEVRDPVGPNLPGAIAMGFGFALTSLLMALKLRLHWWPLHPVAFPLAIADSILELTAAIFITWLVKSLLLRYGGLRAHRIALPFFLGLIAGESTVYFLQMVVWQVFNLT